MQSANRFSALESDDEVEVPQVSVKKQSTEKKVEKKVEKKQQVSVKQEQEKKSKSVNKNEGVDMQYNKPDSRRGATEYGNREGYAPRQGKRQFDRHDGTGRGFRNSKKEGAGQHNWGNEVEEELNIANGVDEVSQVPASDQANIEKSEQIGKGIEDETEKTEVAAEETKVEPPKEKQLTLEEFRKQQKEDRKKFQNKELFTVRQERSADFAVDEVKKIETAEDEDLIKSSLTSKPKKKKVQRSQTTVFVEKDVIGFSPNARRLPRADKPRVYDNDKPRDDKPRVYDNDKPRVYDNDKPRVYDNDKPRVYDNDKPRVYDNDKPRVYDNDKPRVYDNDKPRVYDNDKPRVYDNDKAGKREGGEQRREGGERGGYRGRGRGDFRGRGRGSQRGASGPIDIEDMKSFPVLRV